MSIATIINDCNSRPTNSLVENIGLAPANLNTIEEIANAVNNKTDKENPIFILSSSNDPSNNLEFSLIATNDTTLTFKLKGSDGIIRSATLTLT